MLNDRRGSGRPAGSQVADVAMRAREIFWLSYLAIGLLILLSAIVD
jgi:hypothetical protein